MNLATRDCVGWAALVEYWDDESGATQAVIGPFLTYEAARMAGDDAEENGRVEYMRGVVSMYSEI